MRGDYREDCSLVFFFWRGEELLASSAVMARPHLATYRLSYPRVSPCSLAPGVDTNMHNKRKRPPVLVAFFLRSH